MAAAPSPASPPGSSGSGGAGLPTAGFVRLPRRTLIELLAQSLGQEKAEDVVTAAARDLGLPVFGDYNREQTLAVLERLAGMSGLVGVVARFAKARLILLFKNDGPKSQPPL